MESLNTVQTYVNREKENFEEVKKVIDGDRTRVRQLELEPGDLQIFKGRFTLHRVTKIEGNRSRYLCIPAYVLDPWRVNTQNIQNLYMEKYYQFN
ncbi:MAG: hypothetical protein CM1200mP5_4560 [Candidatus Pelagibacterales bacterium]|nr:MAG: hypothetical protein CM1200mP5_4560 [Pelagibacterales bacterium]